MTELNCTQVEDSATEYALGILPPEDARAVSAHILSCPRCRAEVEDIRSLGDRLLELVPDVEPPLGLDDRIMARVSRRPRRRIWIAAGTAVAAAAAVVGIVAGTGPSHHRAPVQLAGTLMENGHAVGHVYVGGRPSWVDMDISGLGVSGTVTCQLVSGNGAVDTVGHFQLVGGRGSWGAPDANVAQVTTARLLGPDGQIVAQAVLAPE
ncbi:MAG TPA: zf-HC2 domain-containing protein [Acidimicrobiales bacterium]|nr:zf-HC2 domain-containing protein [Acidimicrobiales bacterium]